MYYSEGSQYLIYPCKLTNCWSWWLDIQLLIIRKDFLLFRKIVQQLARDQN